MKTIVNARISVDYCVGYFGEYSYFIVLLCPPLIVEINLSDDNSRSVK